MDPRFNQQPNQPYQPTPMPGQSPMPSQQPYAQPVQPISQPMPQPMQQPIQQMPQQPTPQPYTQPAYQPVEYQVSAQPVSQQPYQPVSEQFSVPQQPAMPQQPQQPMAQTANIEEPGMGIENAYEGIGMQNNPYLADNVVPSMNDTEPITERDPLPEPDPVAEALKAPIQAAAPVPGSIGSNTVVLKPKKAKNNQQTVTTQTKKRNPVLIILIIISVLAIIGLGFVLVMQLYPDLLNFGSSSKPTPSQPSVVKSYLTCERTLKSSELLNYSNATSGVETFMADYGDNEIVKVTSGFELKYENTSNANIGSDKLRSDYVNSFKKIGYATDPFKSNYSISDNVLTVSHEATGDKIDKTNMSIFNLSLAKDGTINTPIDTLKATYIKLNFTCENE